MHILRGYATSATHQFHHAAELSFSKKLNNVGGYLITNHT
jgi:hypothetical protein